MVHKFLYIKSSKKSVIPYLGTSVPFEKSFGEIQGLLMKFGCEDLLTRTTVSIEPKHKLPCTLYSIAFLHKGNRFLIEFPIVIVAGGTRYRTEEKINMNVSGRIMLNKIKALLVDVEMEYLSFAQALLQFQLIADGSGQMVTIQDFVDEHRPELTQGAAAKALFRLGS